MAQKRRSATMMPDWIDRLKKEGLGPTFAAGMKAWAEELDPGTTRDEPDWDDPSVREVFANTVLKVGQNGLEAKVFDAAGLDPKNPFHWRILLTSFCWSLLQSKQKRGRPPEWVDRYPRLARDFAMVQKEKPSIAAVAVCRILKKRFPTIYGRQNESPSAQRIAKEVKKLQNPKFNPMLQAAIDNMLRTERRYYQQKELRWDADVEAQKTTSYSKLINRAILPPRKRAK
jgi:hypothetical protein